MLHCIKFNKQPITCIDWYPHPTNPFLIAVGSQTGGLSLANFRVSFFFLDYIFSCLKPGKGERWVIVYSLVIDECFYSCHFLENLILIVLMSFDMWERKC